MQQLKESFELSESVIAANVQLKNDKELLANELSIK